MMPSTVPSSPMNGVTDAVVASQLMLRSSLASSSLMPICRVRSRAMRLLSDAARLHLPLDFFVAEIEDGDQRRRAELLARDHHGFHAGGFPKRAQKARVRLTRAAQRLPFGKDDRPGIDRETEQENQDSQPPPVRWSGPFPRDLLEKEGNRRFERQFVS